jgi:hypothetical protein
MIMLPIAAPDAAPPSTLAAVLLVGFGPVIVLCVVPP